MTTYPPELSWLPDWRDPSQYPPVKGTTGTQWAWEFLRRNTDYQAAYKELRHTVAGGINPDVPSAEVDAEIDRLFKIVKTFRLVDGLYPPDPPTMSISNICFKSNWFRYYRLDRDQSIPKNGMWDTKILMEFDLSFPVEIQLKQARKILRREGKGVSRYKADNLPDYLRILDVKSTLPETTFSLIAKTIFPKLAEGENITKDHPLVERVKEAYRVALKLRDHDYWKLVSLT